jgi:hypothetical protein
MNKAVLAAGSTTLLLAAMLAVIPAVADERNTERARQAVDERDDRVRPVERADRPIDRPHRAVTVATGLGGAIEADSMHRSHIHIAAVKSADTGRNSTDVNTDYNVERGLLIIGSRNSAQKFEIVPDTWSIDVREGSSAFSAEGKVEDRAGNQYSVSLNGSLKADTENGNLYFVEGKLDTDRSDRRTVELYYLMVVHHNEYRN